MNTSTNVPAAIRYFISTFDGFLHLAKRHASTVPKNTLILRKIRQLEGTEPQRVLNSPRLFSMWEDIIDYLRHRSDLVSSNELLELTEAVNEIRERGPTYEPLGGPFNKEIRARMEELGIKTTEQFADHFGIGRSTMYSLLVGRKSPAGTWIKPSLDTTVALSRALELSPNTIIKRLYSDISLPEDNQIHRVTIVGAVGAGPGQLSSIDDSIVVPSELARGRELVAFRVVGDSMCSHRRPICDGDIIVVNRLDKGSIGAIIVARLDDNSYVCKKLQRDRLVSTNIEADSSIAPVIAASEVAEIVGKVVMGQWWDYPLNEG